MGIFTKKPEGQRQYKVPRGTGALLKKELGLAESHISRCIGGHRKPGPTLRARLEQIEMENRRGK